MEVDLSVKENQIKELENQIQSQQKQNTTLKQSNQILEQKTKQLSSLLEDKEGFFIFLSFFSLYSFFLFRI